MARPKPSSAGTQRHHHHQTKLFGDVRLFLSSLRSKVKPAASWVEYFHRDKLQDETLALSEFVGHVLDYMYTHVGQATKELEKGFSSEFQNFDCSFNTPYVDTLGRTPSYVDMSFTETVLGEFESTYYRRKSKLHHVFIRYVREMFKSTDATAACLIIGLRYMDRLLAELLCDADSTLCGLQSPCSSPGSVSPVSSRSELVCSSSVEDLAEARLTSPNAHKSNMNTKSSSNNNNRVSDEEDDEEVFEHKPLKETSLDILRQMFKNPIKFATWFSVCVMIAAKVHTDRRIKNCDWRDKISTEALMGMSTIMVRQVSRMELIVVLRCHYRLHVDRNEYFRFVQHCYESCPGLKATHQDALSDFCYCPSAGIIR